jgi:hypothetical protein
MYTLSHCFLQNPLPRQQPKGNSSEEEEDEEKSNFPAEAETFLLSNKNIYSMVTSYCWKSKNYHKITYLSLHNSVLNFSKKSHFFSLVTSPLGQDNILPSVSCSSKLSLPSRFSNKNTA